MVIKVPVVITYSNQGGKKAKTAIESLGKSFKKFGLGTKLSIGAATTALAIFAKKSVAAYLAEEKAQKKLSATLTNISKAYALPSAEKFIKNLEISTGISKDQLRPELEKLLLTTRSVGEAQDLLNTALNVSAGSSYSLGQVTDALIKAQKGNFKSLNNMALGLDKATVETGNLYLIQQDLNKLFKNQSAIAAQGLEGDLRRINVAASDSQEIIGKQLSGALETFISYSGGVENITRLMGNFNGSVEKTGGLLDKVAAIAGTVLNVTSGNIALKIAEGFAQVFSFKSKTTDKYNEDLRLIKRIADIQFAAGRDAAAAAKKAAAAEAARLAALRAQKKLAAKFDQENIAIEAALKGKLSDEDRARLLAMKAAKSESADDDMKALEDLNAAQKKAAAEELASIKERGQASFDAITKQKDEYVALQEWLKSNPVKVFTEFTNLAGQQITAPADMGLPGTNVTSTPSKKKTAPVIILNTIDTNATGAMPTTNASQNYEPSLGRYFAGVSPDPGASNITVNVNAGTIADENKLTYIISNELTKFVRFGGITAPAGFI